MNNNYIQRKFLSQIYRANSCPDFIRIVDKIKRDQSTMISHLLSKNVSI